MIEAGYCMLCHGETHTKCGTCGVKKFNDQHTEVEVEWSNGSRMRIGICVHCATKNAHQHAAAKDKITKAHHDHWTATGGIFDPGVTIV